MARPGGTPQTTPPGRLPPGQPPLPAHSPWPPCPGAGAAPGLSAGVTTIRAPRRGTLVMLRTWGVSVSPGGQPHVVGREHLAQHRHALHQREAGADAPAHAAAERDPGVDARPRRRGTARGRNRPASRWLASDSWARMIEAATLAPRGRSMPPIVAGAIRCRTTIGITGCSRIDSLSTASRWSSSPADRGLARPRLPAAGSLASSCSAHASAVAVVSCPASSRVTSWSRSSSSLEAGAVLVAHLQQPGEHVGAVARGRGRYGARGSRRRRPRRARPGSRPSRATARSFCSRGNPQPRKTSGGMFTVLFTSGRSCGEAGLVGDAEDDLEDHLEGERVHPVERAERLARRPAVRPRSWPGR